MLRRTALFTALYVVAIVCGRATAQPETGVALFWPAAGVGVLWVLRARSRREVVTAAGLTGVLAAIGNAVTGVPLAAAVVLGGANLVLGPLVRAVMAASPHAGEGRVSVRRVTQWNGFLGAATVACLAGAALGLVGLALAGRPLTWSSGLGWWLRNMTAIVTIAGPALTLNRSSWRWRRAVAVEAAVMYAASVVAIVLVLAPGQSLPLHFVPLVFVVWAGVRLPLPLAATEGALIAVATLFMAVRHESTLFASIADAFDRALVLQGYMMITVFVTMVLATFRSEITELVGGLRRERAWSQQLVADAPHGIVVMTQDGEVLVANRAMAELFGGRADDLVGRNVHSLLAHPPGEVSDFVARVVAADGELVDREWAARTLVGDTRHVSTSARVVTGPHGRPKLLVNVVDVSERRRFEERLAHLATHDALTGLPNRRLFDHLLDAHLAACRHGGPRGVLLLLDLDHFKEVNDTLGHAAGDHLIRSTGAILRDVVGDRGTVARLGGDEFAVIVDAGDTPDGAGLARDLVSAVREHCTDLGGAHRRVTASVGVASFAAALDQGGDVLALADMLMYDAKEAGRDGFAVLDVDENPVPRTGARMEWRARLEHALEHDLFELHLQPILDIRSGRVTAAEALVRLADREVLVYPDRFIEIAELTGLAPRLDAWVVEHAVELLARLQERDPGFVLEVNLSAQSIGHPDVERTIVEVLARTGVDPGTLVIEVTETAAVTDVPAAQGFADRLRSLGSHFALDDFGAGYGSFYYLKHLSFDHVKIDGEFVADAHRSMVDRQILRSIVDVARNLGKTTVAEYVESEQVLEVVRTMGVDYAQGYLIGRPVPFVVFVATHVTEGALT